MKCDNNDDCPGGIDDQKCFGGICVQPCKVCTKKAYFYCNNVSGYFVKCHTALPSLLFNFSQMCPDRAMLHWLFTMIGRLCN